MMWLVDTAPTFQLDVGAASVGVVTVTITRGDGTAVVTGAATTDNTDGTYSYTLAAASNTRLDYLRLDWTLTATSQILTTFEEIVGNLLFTVEEARTKTVTGQQTPLSSATAYPDPEILRIRREITEWFEDVTARSWIRRYSRMEFHGPGTRTLSLHDGRARMVDGATPGGAGRYSDVAELLSAKVNGVAVTVADIAIDGSHLIHKTGTWTQATVTNPFNVAVEYVYGMDPVPMEATDNGLRQALKQLIPSDLSSFAQAYSSGDGSSVTFPQGGFVYSAQVHAWLKRNKPVFVA